MLAFERAQIGEKWVVIVSEFIGDWVRQSFDTLDELLKWAHDEKIEIDSTIEQLFTGGK